MNDPEPREPEIISKDGVFDVSAAQDVAYRLAGAHVGAEVRIDLRQVREFHDFGVAVLAKALADCPAHVSVHGLRQHHRRLLRYLGISSDGAQAASA